LNRVLPILLLLGGCISAHNTAATSEYARQVSTASLRVAQAEQSLVGAEDRITQLEEVIRLQGRSEAAALENIDEVNVELARLRGAIEVLQFELGELKRSVDDQQLSQEKRQLWDEARLRQIEKFLQIKAPPLPTVDTDQDGATDSEGGTQEGAEADASDAGAEEVPELPADAGGKLDVAASHMEAGRQAVARAILSKAVADHGGDPEMPELRYRYAETFLLDKKYREAILEFQAVIDNHADSDWSCWAYYSQGEAMEAFQGLQQAGPFYKGATMGACKSSEAGKAAKKKL
jgi:TolA-binding protein